MPAPDNNQPEAEELNRFSMPPDVGARFAVSHLERPMNVYPIHESELSSISFLNPLVTGFASVGSALLLFAVGLIVDLAIEGQFSQDEMGNNQLNEFGRALLIIVTPTLGALALICFGGAILAWRKRDSIWSEIKSQSRVSSQSIGRIAESQPQEVK